jgi:hypothetical protein
VGLLGLNVGRLLVCGAGLSSSGSWILKLPLLLLLVPGGNSLLLLLLP